MRIDMEIKEGISILYPPRKFDQDCSLIFQAKTENVMAMSQGPLVINFQSVVHVSSVILGDICMAARDFRREGRPVVLCSVGGGVRKILDSLEFFDLVPVYDTEAAALDAFACVAE